MRYEVIDERRTYRWAPAGPNPGDTVWRPAEFRACRRVSRNVYEREVRAHAVVLREAQAELLADVARVGGRCLTKVARVRWRDDPLLGGVEVEVSRIAEVPHVVGSDSPALRIVHEGLRDVLGWLGWPALPDGKVPAAS